jgi:3-oxoadipate enol-lactonase
MGGMVTLWLAVHHPERLDRAVHACTAARIGPPDVWDARVEMVRAGGMAAVTDVFAQRFFSESFRGRRPEVVRGAQQTLESTSPDGYIASCYAVRDADLRDDVSTIRVPSLVVAAANDVSTPPPEAEWLHARIPGSRLVVLDNAAHLCNVEQPDRFTQTVLDFLDMERNDRSVTASRGSDD